MLGHANALDMHSLSALISSLWNQEKRTFIPTSGCKLYPWGSTGHEGVAGGGADSPPQLGFIICPSQTDSANDFMWLITLEETRSRVTLQMHMLELSTWPLSPGVLSMVTGKE